MGGQKSSEIKDKVFSSFARESEFDHWARLFLSWINIINNANAAYINNEFE